MFHGSKNLFPGIPGWERQPGFRVRAFKHIQYVQILTAMKQVFGPRKQVFGPENQVFVPSLESQETGFWTHETSRSMVMPKSTLSVCTFKTVVLFYHII